MNKIRMLLNNSIMFGEKTLILMIDTSMYDDDLFPYCRIGGDDLP